jgi:hypothetical protein
MDLINPERFLIKGVKSQCKTYEQTKNEDKDFLFFHLIHLANPNLTWLTQPFPESMSS